MKNSFFAFNMDSSVGSVIRAYTIQHSISITRLFNNIIRKWMDNEELTYEKAVNGLANKMFLDWKLQGILPSEDTAVDKFYTIWEKRLQKLPEEMIQEIFDKYEAHKKPTTKRPGETKGRKTNQKET